MSRMMKDPKMREAMKGAAVMQIEMQYAKLIGKLSLNETETTHFKKLLGDRVSAKTDMGFEMMDSSLSKEERKAVTDKYEASKKASDAAIKEFLNDGEMNGVVSLWSLAHAEPPQQAPCSTGGNLRRGAEFKHPCGTPFGFVSKKWNHSLPRRYHHGTTT